MGGKNQEIEPRNEHIVKADDTKGNKNTLHGEKEKDKINNTTKENS